MRYTLNGVKILGKEKRWPDGNHYVCEATEPKSGAKYEFYLDEEEYNAIKAIDDLNLDPKVAEKIMKIIDDYGSFKYSEGSFAASENEDL